MIFICLTSIWFQMLIQCIGHISQGRDLLPHHSFYFFYLPPYSCMYALIFPSVLSSCLTSTCFSDPKMCFCWVSFQTQTPHTFFLTLCRFLSLLPQTCLIWFWLHSKFMDGVLLYSIQTSVILFQYNVFVFPPSS